MLSSKSAPESTTVSGYIYSSLHKRLRHHKGAGVEQARIETNLLCSGAVVPKMCCSMTCSLLVCQIAVLVTLCFVHAECCS